MASSIRYCNSLGRAITFVNPPDLYPVNSYQSLVLAAGAELATLRKAATQPRMLESMRAWEPCCGGGPVALVLKSIGVGFVQATDTNEAAIAVCRNNSAENGLRVDSIHIANLLEDSADGKFDLICCNPPCGVSPVVINTPGMQYLQAVDGGADGMDLSLELVQNVKELLTPDGSLVLIAVSTGNIGRLALELDRQFPGGWHVLPGSPVAAPWLPDEDPRVQALRENGRFQPFTWKRPDGWWWRLSWVIEASTGNNSQSRGFPLHPYGYALNLDDSLRHEIDRSSSDGYCLALSPDA
jgi:SAM-dependent methyltransferase